MIVKVVAAFEDEDGILKTLRDAGAGAPAPVNTPGLQAKIRATAKVSKHQTNPKEWPFDAVKRRGTC